MTLDRTLRIVMFAPHFSEYSTRLATALSERADVLLITETRNRTSECEGLELGVNAPNLARVAYSSNYTLRRASLRGILSRRRVRRAIAAYKPDLIHIQEQGDPFTASIATTFSRDLPIVLKVHDPVPHSGNDALVAQRFAPGLSQLRTVASAYHVHGAHCQALLRQTLRTSKPVVATAHGVLLVPPDGRRVDERDKYLFFGRMEAYKGLDTLLDAIDLLPPDAGAQFILAGRGPELERHRDRIATHRAIELIDGFLPPLDAIRQFRRARAVIVPYRDGTQSGVISAAIGNGRPLIASNVGGLSDAVTHGENGIVIPPDDPSSLAAAIRSLADATTCRRLSEGAEAAARGRFAWSTIAMQLHSLYAELLAHRRAQSIDGTTSHRDQS